ncbi:alpha/beta hydrolase [Nocardioides sp. AX2bis]|uniref:alpha/beta hydrolase n=1 Tax=Nocardioides sp. AX2bis TaxID=2653157 RepID=UPI0012EF751A|nr:alpha/beta hydrolase [Nocardioides sp. AX2bis]VXC41194.1 putative Carboxylesterase B [Nocardioides sp. AX2bis]
MTPPRRTAAAALLTGVLALSLLLPAGPVGAAGAAAGAAGVSTARPSVALAAAADDLAPAPPRFRRCGGARCARVPVPLDHDEPAGPEVRLAVLEVPARRPARRLGTLFVNPGGPGASATSFARTAGRLLGPAVRNRFDVVGVDPRGVGGSEAALCLGRAEVRVPRTSFPRTPAQVRRWLDHDAVERRLCRDERIVDHMSTADTARDLDWVRQALGEDTVTFFGASYGSVLGATYAAMFPDRVRAMVVDGVLDPVAWTTGRAGEGTTVPVTTRLGSDAGTREALEQGLARCDQVALRACALAGPGDALARWDAVADRLRADPGAAGRIRVPHDVLVSTTVSALYAGDLAGVAELVRQVERALANLDAGRTGRVAARALREAGSPTGPFPGPYGRAPSAYVDGSFHGVLCADSVNPSSPQAWKDAAALSFADHGDLGPYWSWSSSACDGWPGSSEDAYRGPFGVPDPARVLVVNNAHDPATPLPGALALRDELGGSPLVVVDGGFGHVATGSDPCATQQVRRFLLTGAASAPEVRCTAEPLFGP